MFRGLRNKFLFLHMGIVTLIVFAFFGMLLLSTHQSMENNADRMLQRALEQSDREPPGGRAPEGIAPRNDEASAGILQPEPGGDRGLEISQNAEWDDFGQGGNPRFTPIFMAEVDDSGKVQSIAGPFAMDDNFYSEVAGLALKENKADGTVNYDGARIKYKFEGNRIAFLDVSKETEMIQNTVTTFLLIAIPLLAVIFLISLYFANRSIRPIEKAYIKQKEFIADASHELKTPLAVISTNVDMLSGSAGEEQQKWLGYVKTEIGRMSDLTGSLLYLTKLDYLEENAVVGGIDLSKLTEDCLVSLEALFYEKNIQTEIDIAPGVKIHGDKERVRRLVGILLDNAIKYTDGKVSLTLEKFPSEARLTVYNTGQGIPASQLEKIWDRFYRGDAARGSEGGFGLGLPIARAVAEKHKGTLTAESKEGEWARFILKLPLEK